MAICPKFGYFTHHLKSWPFSMRITMGCLPHPDRQTEAVCHFQPLGLTRIPKQEWGARASRVQVRASRPNFRHTRFREFPEGKSLPDDVFGATPKTTRPRRVLPETHHCVRFRLRNSG